MFNQKEYNKKYYREHRAEHREYCKRYYHAHRQEIYKYLYTYNPKYYRRIKNEVLGHYSNNSFLCALCGDDKALSIDHINGGGAQHRDTLRLNSSLQFYLWLRRNNFPDGYRVLCRSCNSKHQPTHLPSVRGGSPSRLVLNYFKADNASCSFSVLVSDLAPYATSERAIMMAIQRLYKNGKLTRIERGTYKRTIPQPCEIPEPKNTTGYKPHEVTSIIGYSRQILNTWEKKGLIPPPKRRPSGYRDYSKEEVISIINFANSYISALPCETLDKVKFVLYNTTYKIKKGENMKIKTTRSNKAIESIARELAEQIDTLQKGYEYQVTVSINSTVDTYALVFGMTIEDETT